MKPQLLVFDHVSGPHFLFCATFIAEGDKTRVTVRMVFSSATLREKIAQEFGAIEGLTQTLERLEHHLSDSTGQ